MITLTKCMLCSRYCVDGEEETCEAFPDGIPDNIGWDDEDKECNNGIKFEA